MVARIPSAQVRLTPEAAETRLRALGYSDPRAALRHIEALSQGMTRQAEIQRQLLPAMLTWFTSGPNPDHGLLAFRQVSEALGNTPWSVSYTHLDVYKRQYETGASVERPAPRDSRKSCACYLLRTPCPLEATLERAPVPDHE